MSLEDALRHSTTRRTLTSISRSGICSARGRLNLTGRDDHSFTNWIPGGISKLRTNSFVGRDKPYWTNRSCPNEQRRY